MKKYILLLLSASLLLSCVTRKKCNRKFPAVVMVKDSTYSQTTIEYEDTVLFTPSDSVSLSAILQADKHGKINLSSRRVNSNQASVKVSITDNILQVDAHCDSLQVELQKMKEIHTTQSTRIREQVEVRKEEVIPGFYQFTFWYFLITAALGLIIFLVRKRF